MQHSFFVNYLKGKDVSHFQLLFDNGFNQTKDQSDKTAVYRKLFLEYWWEQYLSYENLNYTGF